MNCFSDDIEEERVYGNAGTEFQEDLFAHQVSPQVDDLQTPHSRGSAHKREVFEGRSLFFFDDVFGLDGTSNPLLPARADARTPEGPPRARASPRAKRRRVGGAPKDPHATLLALLYGPAASS